MRNPISIGFAVMLLFSLAVNFSVCSGNYRPKLVPERKLNMVGTIYTNINRWDSIPVDIFIGYPSECVAYFTSCDIPVFYLVRHYLQKGHKVYAELIVEFPLNGNTVRLMIIDCAMEGHASPNLTGLQARFIGNILWMQDCFQKALQPRPLPAVPTAKPARKRSQGKNFPEDHSFVPRKFAEEDQGDPLPAGNCLPQSFTPAPNGPVFNITGNSGPINIVINGTIYNNQQSQQPVPCPVPPTPGEILH